MSASLSPRLKPRRMWLYHPPFDGALAAIAKPNGFWCISATKSDSKPDTWPDIPVLVIPLTADTLEHLTARAAEGIARHLGHPWGGCGDSPTHIERSTAKAALAAVGIKAPARRKGKGRS